MHRRLFLASAIAPLGLARSGPARAQAGSDRPVLVFAASSLQTAFNAIAREWQQEAGRKVAFSYAASSALARQLDQGAPADLFASADLDWMDWATRRNLIRPETRRTLLDNTLVLIEPADRPATALKVGPGFALAEALGDGRLATGQVQSVPVGRYARQALAHLGLWDALQPRIAGVENARAALALVARGEARFGIVFATDAKAEPRVRIVDSFPADSHAPIHYPVAITANAVHPQAKSFLDALSSPAAIRIFEAEGFRVMR